MLYLRKFKNLAAFNLFGNPFLNEGDYRFFIAANFPKLMFLDPRILDQKTVSANPIYILFCAYL